MGNLSTAHPLQQLRAVWLARHRENEANAFFAPGRVNLLGAHLDYNEGFVLPIAVDRGTYVLACARSDRRIRLESLDREPVIEGSLDELRFEAEHGWANYAKGVLAALAPELPGLDLIFGGDLPIGAGLSSSASILVATATAANHFLAKPRSPKELIAFAHAAEVRFVGVKCGIMDHYASAMGRRDHVLHIDCRTHEHVPVPFDSERAAIVVCDTSKRRELSDGRFNDRVRECGEALQAIRALGIPARALRDVSRTDLERVGARLGPMHFRRALHVASEIERTETGVDALRRHDLEAFGECLRGSHESARALYEVSSAELDALVAAANEHSGCYGARLTGAGFGGCCVAVVDTKSLESFRDDVAAKYERATGLRARIHAYRPSEGARRVAPDVVSQLAAGPR